MKNGRHVVLCIDDEKDVRESLSIMLEANDYNVFTAESAKEGPLSWDSRECGKNPLILTGR